MIFDGGRVKTHERVLSSRQRKRNLFHQKKQKKTKIHQTHFCQRASKNKKKEKKLLDAQKSLLLLKKFSFIARPVENNGPLLRAKRGEEEQQHEQQQKQRSDQRTLRITLKPRPETRRREIRVRGFEYEEQRWENQAPAVYQSWEFRVASSRRERRPPRCEENWKERESKRNEYYSWLSRDDESIRGRGYEFVLLFGRRCRWDEIRAQEQQ